MDILHLFVFVLAIPMIFLIAFTVFDDSSSVESEGVVVGKTIIKQGWGSGKVCVVEYDDTRTIADNKGCLYNEGDKVSLRISSMSTVKILGVIP